MREPVGVETSNNNDAPPVRVKRGPPMHPRRTRGRSLEAIAEDLVLAIGSWEIAVVGASDQVTEAIERLTTMLDRVATAMEDRSEPARHEEDER